MNIAIHISSSFHTPPFSINRFFALRLAASRPEDQFYFIYDKSEDIMPDVPVNVINHVLRPAPNNRMMLGFWGNFLLRKYLKKNDVQLFVGAGNKIFTDEHMKEIVLVWNKDLLKHSFRFSANSPFLKKALLIPGRNSGISNFEKVVFTLPGSFETDKEIDEEMKVSFRQNNCEGFEFFLYLISEKDGKQLQISLLKAFSRFKKWQRSGMKLVILEETGKTPIIPELSSYKYREDVLLISHSDEEKKRTILASAFTGISLHSGLLSDPAIEMIRLGVPVITLDSEENKAVFKEAATYTNGEEADMAKILIESYKNEWFREEQILKGKTLTKKANWEDFTSRLNETINSI